MPGDLSVSELLMLKFGLDQTYRPAVRSKQRVIVYLYTEKKERKEKSTPLDVMTGASVHRSSLRR